jgi:hypothetical protein
VLRYEIPRKSSLFVLNEIWGGESRQRRQPAPFPITQAQLFSVPLQYDATLMKKFHNFLDSDGILTLA